MDVRALGGSAAAVLVVLGAFLPRVRRLAGHLGLIGSLLALASLAVARPGSRASLAALAAWCVVWAVAAVEQERGEAPVVALLRRALGWSPDLAPASRLAGVVPALILAASVPFLVLRAGELGGVLRGRPSWSGVALSLLAVADAAAASWLARRRATARLLAAAAVALALAGIGFAGPDSWPLTLAVAGPIAVAVTLRRELRHPVVTWIAWAASGALAILGAGRAGVADRDLDVVGLAWGAVLLAGGLLLDDLRSGRRAPGEVVRNLWLAAPVTLGAFAAPVAFGVVVIARPAASGWWELAGAAFSLLVALQLRAGVVSVISWALLTLGAATLAPEPWSPSRHPAVLVPWAAALVVAGSALERLSNTRGPRRPEAEPGTGAGAAGWDAWLRWDLPPLAVAHGVALAALVRSADPAVGGQALTWAGVGALCLAVAAWRRSAVYAAIGTVLVLVGAVAGVGAVRAVEGMATVAGVTTLAGLVLWRWRPASPWLRPILLLSGAAGLAAVAVALSVPPRRDLLEIALVVTGLQAAAAGIVLRWRPGLYASPCLLCGPGCCSPPVRSAANRSGSPSRSGWRCSRSSGSPAARPTRRHAGTAPSPRPPGTRAQPAGAGMGPQRAACFRLSTPAWRSLSALGSSRRSRVRPLAACLRLPSGPLSRRGAASPGFAAGSCSALWRPFSPPCSWSSPRSPNWSPGSAARRSGWRWRWPGP